MFELAPGAVVVAYLVIAVCGAAIAVIAGVLFSAVLKVGIHRAAVLRDAILGGIGSVATVIACATIRWPWNTVTIDLGSGTQLQSSMNRFQHPYVAAILVAVVLPALHHFLRFRHARKLGTSK